MRLQGKQRPRDYLAHSEQWRLLLMVFALGAVVLLMVEARDPGNWAWMFGRTERQANAHGPAGPGSQIDNRLPDSAPEQLPPGTVMIEPPSRPSPAQPEEGEPRAYFPGVEPEHLQAMRDDRFTRREEWPAWTNLLGVLQDADEEALEAGALDRVAYSQLFRQSSTYRGRLVTVRGIVHGVFRYPLQIPEFKSPVSEYYQVWLYPHDNPNAPIMAYCLELPEGFPAGDKLDEEAAITGFFLKRTAYKARDGFRTAPTVLARTLRWVRAPAPPQPAMLAPWQWAVLIGGAALFSVLVVLVVYQRTRLGRASSGPAETAGSPPEFDTLP